MSQLPIIEMAVGLSFTYFLLSLLCTILNELIAQVLSLRSKNLKKGIEKILADSGSTDFAGQMLNHPLVAASAGKKGPSYISPAVFSRALVDVLDAHSNGAARLAASRDELCTLIDDLDRTVISDPLKTSLKSLVGQGYGKIEDFQENLQSWFDSSMDRVTGWYKRKSQIISLGVALLLTVALNVDSIHLADQLWRNPALRNQINQKAQLYTGTGHTKEELSDIKKIWEPLEQIPMGWKSEPNIKQIKKLFVEQDKNLQLVGAIITKFIGWIITILAISLGAPFWFDILNKVASIRSSGTKPAPASRGNRS